MDILLAFVLIAVIVLIGLVGVIYGIMLPSKAEEHDLLNLKLQIKYLETKEDGEYLAYRLARAQGYSVEEAEKSALYGPDCRIHICSIKHAQQSVQVTMADIQRGLGASYTMEQAQQELNRLIAKKHEEDCLQLDKAEEELILKRRSKDWDSRWIAVKPKPRKAAVARKGKKK